MSTARVRFTKNGVSIDIEGSEEYIKTQLLEENVAKQLSSLQQAQPTMNDYFREGINHARQWFVVHANQRMQALNFYLIAMAFLCNAFVFAFKERHFEVASAICILGLVVVFAFYFLEQRVRFLLKASEKALRPFEAQMASNLSNQNMEILNSVENVSPGTLLYSAVFKILYGGSAFAFAVGAIYSWTSVSGGNLLKPSQTDYLIAILSGVLLWNLTAAAYKASQGNEKDVNVNKAEKAWRVFLWIMAVISAVALIIIIVILILLFLRAFK